MGEGERKRGRWIATKGRGVGGRKGEKKAKERLSRREGRERRKRRRGRKGEEAALLRAAGRKQVSPLDSILLLKKKENTPSHTQTNTHTRPPNLQPQFSSHLVLTLGHDNTCSGGPVPSLTSPNVWTGEEDSAGDISPNGK